MGAYRNCLFGGSFQTYSVEAPAREFHTVALQCCFSGSGFRHETVTVINTQGRFAGMIQVPSSNWVSRITSFNYDLVQALYIPPRYLDLTKTALLVPSSPHVKVGAIAAGTLGLTDVITL